MQKLLLLFTSNPHHANRRLSDKEYLVSAKKVRLAAFDDFRRKLKCSHLNDIIKIVDEHKTKPQVLIEYDDDQDEIVYNWLVRLPIVNTIYSVM